MTCLSFKWAGAIALALVSAGVVCAQVTITPGTLPAGDAGVSYNQPLAADGGTGPYTWSISSGSLPSGISLDPTTGVLDGSTSAGSYGFTVTATDSLSATGDQPYTLTINPLPTINESSLPGGDAGSYNHTLTASDGTPSYSWAVTAGALPTGTTLNPSTGAITGSASAGTYTFTITVTDSVGGTGHRDYTVTINPLPSVVTSSLPSGEITVPYTPTTLTATGGTPPYTWSLTAGSLGGLTLHTTTGVIDGTPTATTTSVTVLVTDNVGGTGSQVLALSIIAAPAVTAASLPNGEVTASYTLQTLSATGGTGTGYTWTVSAGALPTGMTLSSAGQLSGTPTASGSFNFTAQVTDSGGGTGTRAFPLTINGAPSISTTSPLPQGELGAAYSQTLGATGGSGSGYTWVITSGSVPGLSLSTGGLLSGTPTTAGPFSFIAKVTDSAGGSAFRTFAITVIGGPTITTAPTLPNGTLNVAYSGVTLAASGGTPGYTWSITSGALPTGLSLNGTSGAITGTPTASGPFSITVQVQDALTVTATKAFSLTVISGLTIVTAPTLPAGEVGAAYSQALAAAGGTPSYTWSITSGSLPGGLGLNSSTGALTGTPTGSGTFIFTVRVTDSASLTSSGTFTLNIAAALAITTGPTLPAANNGVSYSQTISASGGVPSYTWTITSGALPGGLTLSSGGAISGTPTTSGNFTFTAQVTDSASVSLSKVFSLSVTSGLAITTAPALPGGNVGSSYSQTLAATGGTPSYTWSITAGALPNGLSLSSGGAISGTPTASGNFSFTVQVTDINSVSVTKSFALAVSAGLTITTPPTLPSGGVGTSYTQGLTATGGSTPYSWSVNSGALPAGLSLGPSTGTINGTPTSVGDFTFTVQVSDSTSVKATKVFTISIVSGLTISTAPVLPGGAIGIAYSQALAAVGGTLPYHWSITAGSLPAGVAINPTSGAIAGTPSSAGTFNFTVQVVDGASVTTSKAFTLTVVTGLTITTAPVLPNGSVGVSYSLAITAAGGNPPYKWSVSGGGLPAGLSLKADSGAISGTPTGSGNFNFTVRVTDNSAVTAAKDFTITVASGLTITTAPSLPNGAARASYSQTLAAAGGTSPYTWSIVQGALPSGLALNSTTGVIGGSPLASGTFTFTVQVTDRASVNASKLFTINVASGLLITTSATLPSGSVGASYTLPLGATGGTPPYRWVVAGGALPGGLTLVAGGGVIGGTPNTAGTFTFTVQVNDTASLSAIQQFTSIIASGLVIATPPQLPGGSVGAGYSSTLAAVGGATPYRWLIIAGALPSGLSLNASTGAITGTPVSGGDFTFTVQVSDNGSTTATKAFTVTVTASLAVTSGPALPSGAAGADYSQTLNATGGLPPYNWSITAGNFASTGLTLSASSGVISGKPSSGDYSFTVQVSDNAAAVATRTLTLSVRGSIVITTSSVLPNAIVGSSYSTTLVATGGQPPYKWSISGPLPAGVTLDANTGIVAGKPTAAGDFSVTIQVSDANQSTASKPFSISSDLPTAPAMTLHGVPASSDAAQQIAISLTLASGYPVDITGQITLTFQPDATAPADDPMILFSTGGRTVNFTIPAKTTKAVFPSAQLAIQTGTISGTINLGFTLRAAGADLPATGLDHSIVIARSAPLVQTVTLTKNTGGFQVKVLGYSTPRNLSEMDLHFTAAAGASLQTTDLTVSLTNVANQWFQGATSATFGSQFILVLPITASQGSVDAVASVSVTLKNSVGASPAVSAKF